MYQFNNAIHFGFEQQGFFLRCIQHSPARVETARTGEHTTGTAKIHATSATRADQTARLAYRSTRLPDI
ncbi:hypothetical protein MWK40_00055 [Escherichia coli]|nr:hypothetical protein [Escherichia coli]